MGNLTFIAESSVVSVAAAAAVLGGTSVLGLDVFGMQLLSLGLGTFSMAADFNSCSSQDPAACVGAAVNFIGVGATFVGFALSGATLAGAIADNLGFVSALVGALIDGANSIYNKFNFAMLGRERTK